MDNLTHSLCGWALARAGLNRFGKWTTPMLVLMANLPDLEPVLLPGNTHAEYLMYHRGITHSPLMLSIYSIVFGAVLWYLERRRNSASAPSYWLAVLICAAGLFSHPLLDGCNSYGVRPGLPFDATWVYGDMLFIVEPWVWLLLALPVFLGSRLNRAWTVFWILLAFLSTTLVWWGVGIRLIGWPVAAVWLSLISLAVLMRCRGQADAKRSARAGLAALACYLLLVCGASRMALERGKSRLEAAIPGASAELVKTSVMPRPAVPWRFDVLLQTNDSLSMVSVNLFGASPVVQSKVKLNLDDPALDTIRETFEYRAWRAFARHPYAMRHGNVLTLGDWRFRSRGGDWTQLDVPILEK